MTATGTRPAPPAATVEATGGRAGVRRWAADLAMGTRFAVTGGREGWARTVLTALGVGLGVTLLLVAASAPAILSARESRVENRNTYQGGEVPKPGPHSVRFDHVTTRYHGDDIAGVRLYGEGEKPAVPPGLDRIPRPGEMVVSPALGELLDSEDGALLAQRLPYRVVDTIGGQGLSHPRELYFYAGVDRATAEADDYSRLDRWHPDDLPPEELSPELVLLIVVGCVVLLLPVVTFIATAVRFGGERRDRRLAALRLVGADSRMTRRIAAGEAMFGALLGLAVGAGLFALLRQLADDVSVRGYTAFPSDVAPSAPLAGLIAVAVPASAVVVTLVALRGVTIEPLGVVRDARPRRRRLWWRLALPAAGLALLLPLTSSYGAGGRAESLQVSAGAVLMLIGTTALLPWAVEAAVARFRGGPLPWQLATRRLQLSSGTAARAVSGITVAVAGAIAVQMLFSSVRAENTEATGADLTRAQFVSYVSVREHTDPRKVVDAFRRTEGVTQAMGMVEAYASEVNPGDPEDISEAPLAVADCASLRELARIPDCRDGAVYLTEPGSGMGSEHSVRPGDRIDLRSDTTRPAKDGAAVWTVPRTASWVKPRTNPMGGEFSGVLITPAAIDVARLPDPTALTMVSLDPEVADALELARNTDARFDSDMNGWALSATSEDEQFADVRKGLLIGATATLLLIGASMIVSTLEQLRERRRLLAVLVAFGTRRSTVGWSVLWQTAVPVVIGLAISVAGGLALGTVLLKMIQSPVAVDWASLVTMTGIGAGVIALVTLVSMGPLWRMMRPDGLRTE
ncbi:ABC transporter permease [Streptomyces sp. NPDC018031]|uniref:ABC transporter permease n=1 Tax=Streptomyces sp. NPDC018031 TaxID=3365033 RepID=UPI003797E93F